MYLWLIHVDIWQKTTQYCKVIILQLKNKLKNKMWCICTMEYYSGIERNEIGSFVKTWIELETVRRRQISYIKAYIYVESRKMI